MCLTMIPVLGNIAEVKSQVKCLFPLRRGFHELKAFDGIFFRNVCSVP